MITINWNIIWTVVNIIILFILLRIFLWKPVLNMMEKRKNLIQGQLDDAAAKDAEAEKKREQYENSLKSAKTESAQIVSEAKNRAQTQYDQIVEQANTDAADILEKAGAAAEADRAQALRDAQTEIAGIALAAASKLLGANVDAQSNKKMLDDFLAEAGAEK